MDRLIVEGGQRLSGEIQVSGAKNAALPILVSSLLSPHTCVLENIPDVVDVRTMCQLLGVLGATTSWDGPRLLIRTETLKSHEAPYALVSTMRASILVLGPLVARWGEAIVPLPGGCAIGSRPVNLHIDGLRALGAEVRIQHGNIHVKAKRLKGARIAMEPSSVTGTENLMMAAVLAEGVTVIENAAREPEVADLAAFLIKRGARIQGCGTNTITIEGVEALNDGDHHHRIMADRMEAGTYLIAGAVTQGDVTVHLPSPDLLDDICTTLHATGAELSRNHGSVRVTMDRRASAVDVTTGPCPGFPTDLQAQMAALLSLAEGVSLVTETVFENRLTHVSELRRMGANITTNGNQARIVGVDKLSGAPVMASDLRGGAALILASLAAEGETIISRVYHVDRGYERIEGNLNTLGANVCRVKSNNA
ncbi:MAG TPA: UDP-N-acetylglucosamine 1-carboxyvinyltransferase [Nitrospirales bacterium]|nr:UDP-N-acetylglucosamine 1-carboxyvinyltransferase [Nitrospirales bacterium]